MVTLRRGRIAEPTRRGEMEHLLPDLRYCGRSIPELRRISSDFRKFAASTLMATYEGRFGEKGGPYRKPMPWEESKISDEQLQEELLHLDMELGFVLTWCLSADRALQMPMGSVVESWGDGNEAPSVMQIAPTNFPLAYAEFQLIMAGPLVGKAATTKDQLYFYGLMIEITEALGMAKAAIERAALTLESGIALFLSPQTAQSLAECRGDAEDLLIRVWLVK
uniref:Uncharacterized protein n=1 Tax=Candidatus Methanophaga sp. ANME-1 ERB7 TaxID=2759913 RepID=A0A7G9Z2F9_9EURY|nr:hypothetical protein IPKNHHKO_00020 [Methanosarcinales archaeon ANME-1 ERB7]